MLSYSLLCEIDEYYLTTFLQAFSDLSKTSLQVSVSEIMFKMLYRNRVCHIFRADRFGDNMKLTVTQTTGRRGH